MSPWLPQRSKGSCAPHRKRLHMLPTASAPAGKVAVRKGIPSIWQDMRIWLLIAAVVLSLGLISLRGAWKCHDKETGSCVVDMSAVRDNAPLWFNASCPLVYDRIGYEEMLEGKAKPYLLGENQRPNCTNCAKDELWAHFCKFKSHGPACPQYDQDHLLDTFLDRVRVGAPGAQQLLELTPCDLFPYIRGRTLWLVGDSMMQEFMRAMQCFTYEFWDLNTKPLDSMIPDKAAMEDLIGGWCVLLPEQTRICHVRCNMGDWLVETLLPKFRGLGIRSTDIMVLNFAVWVNHGAELEEHVRLWADAYIRSKDSMPFIIWRDSSVQHFDTPTGDYKCDGCPDAIALPDNRGFHCKAMPSVTLNARNELESEDPVMQIIVQGGWRNKITLPIIEQLGIPIMHTWNLSVPLWEYHHGFQERDDCTHWCHPSGYQVWVAQLYEVLRQQRDHIPAPAALHSLRIGHAEQPIIKPSR